MECQHGRGNAILGQRSGHIEASPIREEKGGYEGSLVLSLLYMIPNTNSIR